MWLDAAPEMLIAFIAVIAGTLAGIAAAAVIAWLDAPQDRCPVCDSELKS